MSDADLTADEIAMALKIAHEFVDAGVPVFVAEQCPPDCPIPQHRGGPGEYHRPMRWQTLAPSHERIERWQPGMALAAIGGWTADFLDIDPRSGGLESEKELKHPAIGQFPRSFGQQATPSGGSHHVISKTGERKSTGFMPGLDLQSGGAIDHTGGAGRGFIWIAPTIRPSKAADTLGQLRPYRWVVKPDFEALASYARTGDDSLEGIVGRIRAKRGTPSAPAARDTAHDEPFMTATEARLFGQGAAGGQDRSFTMSQAQDFVRPFLISVQQAQIGEIEERCNAAAAVLSHFVPSHWSVDAGMDLLSRALSHTAYDPAGPSTWTVEKFRPVLNGSRPTVDPWPATLRTEHTDPAAALDTAREGTSADEVERLIAEMLTLSQVKEQPEQRFLVKGWLNLDSEAWMIGAPGTKKSFVALDLACHVAHGKPWQGLKTAMADVIIIAAEGAAGMRNRVRAWEIKHGALPANVHVLPRPVQVSDVKAWAVLVEAARRLTAGRDAFIVIDTQARVTVGLKENDATDMGYYVAAKGALRRATGGCIFTLHHTGRNGGDARGSSAIDGAQDTELKVIKKEAFRGELWVEKQKDLDGTIPPLPLVFERVVIGTDEDGDEITSLVLVSDPFDEAHGQTAEPLEEWETGHAAAIVQLFKVLRDQGGQTGLTKTEARAAIVERFYSNEPARLKKSTYYTAWSRGQEKTSVTGDPVMVNVAGQRWTVDPEALATMPPNDGPGHKTGETG